jgi:ketosteroid isomerase-like protein
MAPKDVLKAYEAEINRHDFDLIVPLISREAVFWFNDGSYRGTAAIRQAFEATWQRFPLERYWLEDLSWIAQSDSAAACTYRFCWEATIEGAKRSGGGRGTTVLTTEGGEWKIIHEHLSQHP